MVPSLVSSWRPVASGVAQGCVLGSVLLKVLLSDVDEGTECLLSQFAEDPKVGGEADGAEGCAALQRGLDRLESCLERFNKGKSEVLHVGRNKALPQYRLGAEVLERSTAVKELGVLA